MIQPNARTGLHGESRATSGHLRPPSSPSADLDALAERLRRLRPDRHNPELYFEEKAQIEAELRRLSREVRP